MRKRYLYKVYDSSLNYITTWNDVMNDPEFTDVINGAPDVIVTQLARNVNAYGEGDDIDQNNYVFVWCFDGDAVDGVLVFSGYISEYTPTLKGNEEYLEVQIFSFFAQLNRWMYEDSGTEETTIVHSSVSPMAIMEDIFDKFTADGGLIDYGVGTLNDPGTTVSYTFNTQTVREAFDKVIELSPVGWYAHIGADNIVHYANKNTDADHIFTIGKDIALIQPQKRIQSIVNKLYFTGGDGGSGILYKKYTRSSSITDYGLYVKKVTDQRVTAELTADTIAGRILDTSDAPEIRTKIILVDNNGFDDGFGYDIESVHPGDTVKVLGFSRTDYTRWDEAEWDVDVWDYSITDITATVQQIQKVTYHPDYIEIELSNRLPDITKRIEDINRNLVDSLTANNPATPLT